MKDLIKRIPVLGKLLTALYRKVGGGAAFAGSKQYWEERYAKGGTSGSGSYGQLAVFKANILNNFVKERSVATVLEFGCGDGNQLTFAQYPFYTGLDVSETAIEQCREKFRDDHTKQFRVFLPGTSRPLPTAQLSLSLDVIYHLVEDSVFEDYMRALFASATNFVIIYASNEDGQHRHHERTRRFTVWVDASIPEWKLTKRIPNQFPYDPTDPDNTSQSDFFIYERV